MKNKGYTLIEIIGVIVILSLIIMISVPTISGVLKNSKNKAYNVQVSEIKSASESWSLLNYDNVPQNDGDTVVISVLQLKLANLLPYDFKNPKTGELFPDDMQISITKKGNNLVYEVLTNTGTTNEILNPLAPQIILIGGINENVEINSTYKELGATAKDKDGNGLTVTTTITNSSGNTVSAIDASILGKYTISYSATKDSLTSTIKRIVNVVDTIPPVVTVTGYTNNQYIDLESISTYTLPTASVVDNSNTLVTYQVIGNFSPIIPGSKQVIYEATDESGNIGKFTLNFNVKDTIIPTATYTTTVNPTTGRKEFVVTASDSGTGLHEYAYSYDDGATWKKENTFIYEDVNNIKLKVRDKAGNIKSATPLVLTIKPNGGIWNSLSSDSTINLEQGSTTTIANPTRAGYTFTGWAVSGSGSSMSGTTFTMGGVNTTITANWTPNNYTLTVDANSGTWSGTTPQTIASGSTVTIANPTRTNYNFTGWTVSGSGSSISGTTFTMGSDNTTITANWTQTTFTLTVDASGGTWSGTTPQNITIGGTTTIANPTRTNYTFTGWTVSGSGSSITGTTFTMGSANTTITANWVVSTYNLTVNANGGSWGGTTPQTIASGSTVTIANPTRTNYSFAGWTVSGSGSSISGTTFTMGNENATITANWALTVANYAYTGNVQAYTVSATGTYKLEVWGAQGGNNTCYVYTPGYGGYTSGNKLLSKDSVLYVYIGGQGGNGACPNGSDYTAAGGYNGGGSSTGNGNVAGAGGGASDLRLNGTTLNDRIIVAGGGGGAGNCSVGTGGNGSSTNGVLGSGTVGTYAWNSGSGGGGGYYGGLSGAGGAYGVCSYGASGGSGYIGGVTDGSMTVGTRTGNGYATITYIGS